MKVVIEMELVNVDNSPLPEVQDVLSNHIDEAIFPVGRTATLTFDGRTIQIRRDRPFTLTVA